MILQDLIAALELPASSRVDQRIPKKLLAENGAPTAADKRNINEGIEEIQWVASLKSSTIGVPEYRDNIREYLEITVLHVALRQEAKAARIVELTHRAIPYPLMLLLTAQDRLILSMAHIRWAQNEVGKVVVDGDPIVVDLVCDSASSDVLSAFFKALSVVRQPRENLKMLYQGWLDTLVAFQAAKITGKFAENISADQAETRRASLRAYRELEQKISVLQSYANKEKQIPRQVDLNLEIKALKALNQKYIEGL